MPKFSHQADRAAIEIETLLESIKHEDGVIFHDSIRRLGFLIDSEFSSLIKTADPEAAIKGHPALESLALFAINGFIEFHKKTSQDKKPRHAHESREIFSDSFGLKFPRATKYSSEYLAYLKDVFVDALTNEMSKGADPRSRKTRKIAWDAVHLAHRGPNYEGDHEQDLKDLKKELIKAYPDMSEKALREAEDETP